MPKSTRRSPRNINKTPLPPKTTPLPKNINNILQFVIDMCGYDIMLQLFSKYLGGPVPQIYCREDNKRVTRNLQIPKGFKGLGFDGNHWKAFKNNTILESYGHNIQQQEQIIIANLSPVSSGQVMDSTIKLVT
jgi:hypothetical protein